MNADTFTNTITFLAALAIVGVVVGAFILSWHRDRQHAGRLAELAVQRGWQYQAKPEGNVRLRLSGREAMLSTLFQEKYIALTRDAESARRLLSPGVAGQMLDWPLNQHGSTGPAIVADEYGVIVRVRSDGIFSGGTERLERMVNLGTATAHALARA